MEDGKASFGERLLKGWIGEGLHLKIVVKRENGRT